MWVALIGVTVAVVLLAARTARSGRLGYHRRPFRLLSRLAAPWQRLALEQDDDVVTDKSVIDGVTLRRGEVARMELADPSNDRTGYVAATYEFAEVDLGEVTDSNAILAARARWSSEMRRLVARLELDVQAYDTTLRIEAKALPASATTRLVDLAWCVTRSEAEVVERLGRLATAQSNVGWERAAELLLSYFPRHAETQRVARLLVNGYPSRTVLAAAKVLGEEGALQLERLLETRTVDLEVRAGAFRALADVLPAVQLASAVERAEPVLLEDLRSGGSARDLVAMVRAVAMLGSSESERALVEAVGSDEESVRELAASKLHARNPVLAESRLLELLQGALEPRMRLFVAQALGRLGTLRAVPPLRVVADDRELMDDIRGAAERSIEQVQQRCSRAAVGALSMADTGTDDGALSLAYTGGLALASPATPEPAEDE